MEGKQRQNDNCVKCNGDKDSHSLADTHNEAEFDVNQWKQSVVDLMFRNIYHWQKNQIHKKEVVSLSWIRRVFEMWILV